MGTILGIAQIGICNTTGVVSKRRKQLLNYSPRNTMLISSQRRKINDKKYVAALTVYVKIGKTRPGGSVGWWDGEL